VRHHRPDAYSAEQVLLNKRQIYGGTPKLHWYRWQYIHTIHSRQLSLVASACEMTYIVSGGALNSTHSLTSLAAHVIKP